MILVEIGTIGTGLFMAGLYGTAMGNSGTLMKRYPLCMGMFIVLPGAVSITVLALIGALAQKFDIHIVIYSCFPNDVACRAQCDVLQKQAISYFQMHRGGGNMRPASSCIKAKEKFLELCRQGKYREGERLPAEMHMAGNSQLLVTELAAGYNIGTRSSTLYEHQRGTI